MKNKLRRSHADMNHVTVMHPAVELEILETSWRTKYCWNCAIMGKKEGHKDIQILAPSLASLFLKN